ncbi:MAG TPA: hypothetical protein VMH88_03210 [Gemmatimonadales bacterium]|nr:hypothetical protein [Gemmatimonadales bacterium]
MLVPLLWVLALQSPGDEGTLVLREDTSVVGQESFAVTGLTANGVPNGWRVGTRARYGMGSRSVLLAPVVEIGPDTEPVSLQYEVSDPANPVRILGASARGRFTLRYLSPDRERTREISAGPGTVVLDDSAFALYLLAAWRARASTATVSGLFARAMRKESLTVTDLGTGSTTVNRQPVALRHITVTGGTARLVHVWLDAAGRLMKVEVPSRRMVGERAAGP